MREKLALNMIKQRNSISGYVFLRNKVYVCTCI
jgi:hypothetical protein